MSWLDKIKGNILIRTGDARQYSVQWNDANALQEFNVAQFEFPDTAGTLVKRSEPKGLKFNVTFYIQGEDHLDDAEAFRISANDKRAWTISHPYYGSIVAQPISLNYDNSKGNVTIITGTLIETITDDSPKTSQDPVDKISIDKANLDVTAATAFANNIPEPEITDVLTLQQNNAQLYAQGKKKIKTTIDAENYFNLFNSANTKILNASSDVLAAITQMQAMINAPGLFIQSVRNRIDLLVGQFEFLRDNITGITDRNKKRIYETNANSVIGTMLLASSVPQPGDYGNRNEVFDIVDIIVANYNLYAEDLDSLQTDNGGGPDSFIPDASALIALNDLFNFTIANLFNIALESKQERTFILEDDSNGILLAHRLYGLQPDDSTIDAFMAQNSIGLSEILQIKKGRSIKYYV